MRSIQGRKAIVLVSTGFPQWRNLRQRLERVASMAREPGMGASDVIVAVNDTQVDSPRDVTRMVGGLEAGRMVQLSILRKGKSISLTVPLGIKPESVKPREG